MNTAASTHPLLTITGKLPEARRLARAVRTGLVDRDELDRRAQRLAEDTARTLEALGHRRAALEVYEHDVAAEFKSLIE